MSGLRLRSPASRTGSCRRCLDTCVTNSSSVCSHRSTSQRRAVTGTARSCCASQPWGSDPVRLLPCVLRTSTGATVRSRCAHARLAEVRYFLFRVNSGVRPSPTYARSARQPTSVVCSYSNVGPVVGSPSRAAPCQASQSVRFDVPRSNHHSPSIFSARVPMPLPHQSGCTRSDIFSAVRVCQSIRSRAT